MAEQAIESFAELMARLDEPFADRARVLHAAGLDDGDVQRMADRWSSELQGDGAAALVSRYGEAYEAAVRDLASARRGERAAPDLRFLNADAQSFRDEAAAVPLQGAAEIKAAPPPPARIDVTPLAMAPPRVTAPPVAPPPLVYTSEPAPSRGSPWIPEGMRNFKDVHGTQVTTDAPPKPALPFDSNRPATPAPTGLGEPPFSLEQYASICVDLAADPPKRAEILGRYRVSEAQHRRAEAYWRARMDADPGVRVALDRAFATYRIWLVQWQSK